MIQAQDLRREAMEILKVSPWFVAMTTTTCVQYRSMLENAFARQEKTLLPRDTLLQLSITTLR